VDALIAPVVIVLLMAAEVVAAEGLVVVAVVADAAALVVIAAPVAVEIAARAETKIKSVESDLELNPMQQSRGLSAALLHSSH
jgi:hypothetical protein